MFSGATPRDVVVPSPRTAEVRRSVTHTLNSSKNTLNADLERIFQNKLSSRVLYEALLQGVEGATLGSDRVHTCEARQRDAEAVMAHFEDILKNVGEDSQMYTEEDARYSGKNGRREATLNWVVASIDMFQKAIASLEAHELLARRACRNYDTRHATRLSSYETGGCDGVRSARLSPRMCPAGTPRNNAQTTASFLELHHEAAALQLKVEERIQDLAGPRQPLDTWRSWLFSSMGCCTTRQGEADHSSSVTEITNSMTLRALQAEKGDILCCTPIQVDLDGVRYRSSGQPDGRVLPMAVKRGEKVPVKGRTGDWIWNSKGYLPLRHPGDGSVLFLFDHKRPEAADQDSEDSSDGEDGPEAKTDTGSKTSAGYRRPVARKASVKQVLKPNLGGATPSAEQQNGTPRKSPSRIALPGGAPPPLDLQNDTPKFGAGQTDPSQEARTASK